MVKLILVVAVAALVVAGMGMAVDAGHGDGNGFSDAAGCAQARGLLAGTPAAYDFGSFLSDLVTGAGCAVNGQ
jgi:hypothetical protein